MKTVKSMFNLIEITMAIAVVGIGIAGIMALFPPALEANRTANVNNYVGGMLDTMASFIEYSVKGNWNKYILNSSTAIKSYTDSPVPPTESNSDSWSSDNTVNFPGLYEITKDSGNFAVRNHDKSVEGHIRIWKDHVTDYNDVDSKLSLSTDYEKAARVFIELSWPITAPYINRERKVLIYEFYRQ